LGLEGGPNSNQGKKKSEDNQYIIPLNIVFFGGIGCGGMIS